MKKIAGPRSMIFSNLRQYFSTHTVEFQISFNESGMPKRNALRRGKKAGAKTFPTSHAYFKTQSPEKVFICLCCRKSNVNSTYLTPIAYISFFHTMKEMFMDISRYL